MIVIKIILKYHIILSPVVKADFEIISDVDEHLRFFTSDLSLEVRFFLKY